MKYVKVSNLFTTSGMADYKGLDIDNIVAGTQLYPQGTAEAYFGYAGDVVSHDDLEVITVDDYQLAVQAEMDKPRPPSELDIIKARLDAADSALLMLMDLGVM